jgi:hypothetical protein
MTYQELVKKVSKALTAADASGIGEHVAVQVNVTGEAEGWFYVEVAEGKVMVEPYTYDDKDACMTADGADVLALSTGKLALEQGLTEGRLTVDGSYDKFMLLSGIFAQMPVKKARKTAAKKTDDAEKPAKKPAAKKTTKKTTTKKAAETAEMILKLRQQRLQIVTGDTDATYSGEAMGAAIDEITRLEKEYMTLFVGYSDIQQQKMRFDVVPQPGLDSQMYVAFRLSDAAGLVPADNLYGKPIVMEIVPQAFAEPQMASGVVSNAKEVQVYYRIPAVCTVKIMDGTNLLLQSRMPIYQLGRESSLPVNVILK